MLTEPASGDERGLTAIVLPSGEKRGSTDQGQGGSGLMTSLALLSDEDPKSEASVSRASQKTLPPLQFGVGIFADVRDPIPGQAPPAEHAMGPRSTELSLNPRFSVKPRWMS